MPNKAKLVTRSASTTSVVTDTIPKSDTLTHIELDSNLLNLRDATFGIAGDDSATIDVGMGNTLKIAGTQNVTTAATGQTVTITGPDLSSYATTTYVDNKVNANNTLTIADDTSTTSAINLDNTLQVLGGHNITTSISGSTLTIAGDKIIDVNEISSSDSSAIQINDALNVSGATTINNTLEITGGKLY
jgi:3-deoxy-D-manno-octulosonic-acid transferase